MVTTSIGAQENFLGGGAEGRGGAELTLRRLTLTLTLCHYDDYDVMTINIMPLVHLFLPTL